MRRRLDPVVARFVSVGGGGGVVATAKEAGTVCGVLKAAEAGEGSVDDGMNVEDVGDVALEGKGVVGLGGADAGGELG